MGIFSLFTPKLPLDIPQIEEAILRLEQQTSAELRVVVERKAKKCTSALARAQMLFDELGMTNTAQRNGVLLYLSFQPHYVAVVGDEAIHRKVGDEFWQSVYDLMKDACQKEAFTHAICLAIAQIAEKLAQHFPLAADDVNELSNEVVIK